MFRGKTIDEPPQQLDTQVIVDVTLAINNEPDWQLGSRVSVEDFTKFDERETRMPAVCYHGTEPEGVGKTSTAECVADKTKRPLFPITCGDIGESAVEVEKNLHHNFLLAYKWGCVLLLDEADIFLAKRNKTDLRRNAVTSVFLRSLEYYAGILFLTTNRVGGIDPAFKSRIQLSLYYPRIDLDTTMKLYHVFLKRARDEQERIGVTQFKIKQKEILKFASRHYRRLQKEGYNTWNGRQIRNACQTAIALVEHEAAHLKAGQPIPVLGKKHFETVAEGSKEFDRYLKRTLQGGDDEIAMRDQWRNDYYQEVEVTRPSSLKPLPKTLASSSRTAPPAVTDSESESSDESETESKDDEDGNIKPVAEGGIAHLDAEADVDEDEISNADFKEFLKFKALMGKNKKK
ncbi:hypothetical protein SLS64_014260 [Diaporthe eres]